jgi:hypothetical protein
LSNTDPDDTIDSFKTELNLTPVQHPQIIEQAILMCLERKDADVDLMSDLFAECLKVGFFQTEDFAQG